MLGVRAAPSGGCVQVAIGDPVTGRLITVATRSELRRGAGAHRRTTAHPSRREVRRRPRVPADGPGAATARTTSAYRPTAHQQRFVRVRDRTCRMPGCRRAPGRCDIDHGIAHADGGPTDCWNLCCLCRRHHRIKTFARDWYFQLLADGTLIVRTPSGVSRITRPTGWCMDGRTRPTVARRRSATGRAHLLSPPLLSRRLATLRTRPRPDRCDRRTRRGP